MKFQIIRIKNFLEITINYILKNQNHQNGIEKKALYEDYIESTDSRGGLKDNPHILFASQIDIEQL